MTIDEIVTLIQAVSDNGLTSFVYEEGDQKLILKICLQREIMHFLPFLQKERRNITQNALAKLLSGLQPRL